jgi:hypothetical protein
VTGAEYPSVTTVLGIVGKGEALKHWAAGEVAKFAVNNKQAWQSLDDAAAIDLLKREPLRFLDRAASRGTDVHALAETYAKTGTMPQWADEISGYVAALKRFFDEHQPQPVLVEHTVFNSEIGYAGSFDMVCKLPTFGDELVVLDYKTSKAIYPDVAAQLAAYAHGTEYIDDDKVQPMPAIARGVAVRLAADATYEVIECDVNAGWTYFKAVRAVFDIPTKPFLLGDVRPSGERSDEARAEKRDWLMNRVRKLKEVNSEAFAAFAARWSPAIPTFKSQHQHSSIELRQIEQLLVEIERDFSVPFHEHVVPPSVKRPPQIATPAEKPMPPSDDITVATNDIELLRMRLNDSANAVKLTAKRLAKEAAAVKRSVSLSGKPSLRRYMIVSTMLDFLDEDDGSGDTLDAALRYLDIRGDDTLGAAVGNLDIAQVQQMSNVLAQLRAGTLNLQYINDTFTITEGK